ncbi:mechanosensitive ion channel family protein [Pseudoalteromonas lipolytica]|jgi:small conductance mechanosensitive channel|uniref:Small-conductance mechanosensitive channel n=2 Tax=Gammaproteobacteria TaxID=1236 RepID=A0AAD0WDJ8_9GAMM|nr:MULTISPECIES: mechanosensitive ion channel domain-containing protein [Pseudoalteromonas]AXV66488.1 mechanosensitive ion channel family protein [Pseudoalteromonas donghaensis]EWH04615.1 mechanosensitive ion channel protein [Pseudoalteromonas lipolytica SCSIO 04301]MBE0349605.1 small conductance mechanosensitive channel [Pseudoalteromonas lipolytica LMEB 39]MCC9661776.1 mechanosensitive ion channel [Pseudoalteromonas sp. MB41]QLJ08012.1 mechanosensitive ion channel [Pseudoalteromonas sp. JSTW|tara:strand:- start:58 stop:876 length:819 start_codon:yes stop_codon:yes gene_type:complete
MDTIMNWINENSDLIIHYAVQAVLALIIFFIGSRIAKFCEGLTEKAFDKKKVDKAVGSFVASIVYAIVFAATILMALSQLGIETTSFIAILGAAGLAVGLALQGSLSNFASGVLIILLRPFKSGDYVEAGGKAGTVKKIEIFSTEMRTPDNKVIVMPNSKIMGDAIVNYSRESTRRIDLVIGVGYDADLKEAKAVLKSVLDKETRLLKDPAYTVAVSELADSSVNFVVRPWVNSADYWPTYFDLMENIKIALDDANITIPFPQMDVHLHKED